MVPKLLVRRTFLLKNRLNLDWQVMLMDSPQMKKRTLMLIIVSVKIQMFRLIKVILIVS